MRLHEKVSLQFCLAHLIRDVKFLAEHPDPKNRAYGQRLLGHFRKLFGTIHRRDQYASEATFQRALGRIRNDLVWDATMESPHTPGALNLEERFYLHTESYFRFITEPGQTWCERIWTVVVTCEQNARSVFAYLVEAITAHFRSGQAPSLLFDHL